MHPADKLEDLWSQFNEFELFCRFHIFIVSNDNALQASLKLQILLLHLDVKLPHDIRMTQHQPLKKSSFIEIFAHHLVASFLLGYEFFDIIYHLVPCLVSPV